MQRIEPALLTAAFFEMLRQASQEESPLFADDKVTTTCEDKKTQDSGALEESED
jgi:hypothetical protein